MFLLADVKPSNVLINTQGQVKMCDFGISGYLVDSVAKTMDAGCKPYMAVSWEDVWETDCPTVERNVAIDDLKMGELKQSNFQHMSQWLA